MEPLSTGIAKTGVSAGAKPTLEFFRTQWARRGAACADLSTLGTADREMDEALAVLKGDAAKLPQTIWVKLKGYFSDRPASFDTENASHFISDDRVVQLVKDATRKTFANEDISKECQSARVLYASLFDDAELYEGAAPFGERLLEDAVAFTFATLVAYLTPGDRILLETLTSQISDAKAELAQNMDVGFADISNKIAEISKKGFASDSIDIRSQVDEGAIDKAVLEETKRFKRRRFIQDDKLIDDGRSFAGRLQKGLSFGTPSIRAEAFRELAIIFARVELIDDATAALERATSICDIDVTPEHARLLMVQNDFDSALKLLRCRHDPASISMFIQAIYAQRLAKLLHAAHIARILDQHNVERPDLHERVLGAFQYRARLSDYRDLQIEPYWQAIYLQASTLTAEIFRRSVEAVQSIPDDLRPSNWTDLGAGMMKYLDDKQANLMLWAATQFSPFLESWNGLTELDEENVDNVFEILNGTDPAAWLDRMFKLQVSFEIPQLRRGDYRRRVTEIVETLNGEQFIHAVEMNLHIAARWRDAGLSDDLINIVFRRFKDDDVHLRSSLARQILLASACEASEENWLERLRVMTTSFARIYPERQRIEAYRESLMVIAGMSEKLAQAVAPALSMASLIDNEIA